MVRMAKSQEARVRRRRRVPIFFRQLQNETAVDFLHASVAFDDEVVAGVADFPFHIFQRDNVGVIVYQDSSARQGNRGGVDAF